MSRHLITNVNVFDGVNEQLLSGASVLVEDDLIVRVAQQSIDADGATVIDGGGGTLMPGLIDAHWHSTYAYTPESILLTGDILEVAIISAQGATGTLLRGFTTVRDVGGNPFAIKKLSDNGTIAGPRVLPAGAPISQTSGHFDFRSHQAVPSSPADPADYWQRTGFLNMIADGVPEMMKRARENLRMGACFLKIAGGGGVSSTYDPLDVQEFTMGEIRAIVDVADTWGTYVAAHILADRAVRTSVEAGVKSIEHAFLASEETLQLMKDKGAWLSIQPLLNDEDALKFDNEASTEKFVTATDGTDRVYNMGKDLGVKMAFGTDMLFDPAAAAKQGKMLWKLGRWFTPYEALRMATSTNAELLELSGQRHPYQKGPLGRITEGAYADLIVVDGNPLEDLELVVDADKNFALIMKDGKVFKNTFA